MTTLLRTYTIRRLGARSLLRGAASAFDLRGQTSRQYVLGSDAGVVAADAIRADFEAVGADLRAAMRKYPSGE